LGNIRNKPHLIFSDDTIYKAIKSLSGELAWRKEDIFQAINELALTDKFPTCHFQQKEPPAVEL
jgi:hypothetical protein